MRTMVNAENKFRAWLAEQPTGTKWTARDVMTMMKGNMATELTNVACIKALMARFSNVECKREGTDQFVTYRKVRECDV